MYATNYFESKLLSVFSGTPCLAPANLYIGLFLSSPTETGTSGIEVSYPEYSRQLITFTPPYEESGGIGIKNQSTITWNTSSIDAGQVNYIGILDSSVVGAGNMWLYGDLTDSMPIHVGNQPTIQAGDIVFYSVGNFSHWFNTVMMNVFRGTTVQGLTPHLALYSGDPESTGVELSGGSYARPAITFGTPVEQIGGQSQIQNTQECMFPVPTSIWGLWAYDGIMNAASGGNLITKVQNSNPETILKNYIPYFEVGAYKVALN